jgi:exonuclease SbcC
MIPARLTLKNFMSYGEEPESLDFDGVRVACLSGDNGNGKSALLDAMSWALWGRTRASVTRSVTDDDLIRLGADDVEVQFDFYASGSRFRVLRRRRRGRAGGAWDLSRLTPEGEYAPLGAGGLRDTGREIVRLIGMEYETFLNSAYLQQGRADEFTRQTPDNRKRILGEILGLTRFDFLESRSRDISRERRQAMDELEGRIRILDGQIGRRSDFESLRLKALTDLEPAQERLREWTDRVADLRKRIGELEVKARSLETARSRVARVRSDLAGREAERIAQQRRLDELTGVMRQKQAILRDYELYLEAARRRDTLEPQMDALSTAQRDLRDVVGAIDLAAQSLRGELKLAQEQLQSVQARTDEHRRLTGLLGADERRLEALPELERSAAESDAQCAQLQAQFADLSAQNRSLKEQIEEVDEVLSLLARPRPVCPVCASDLGGERHEAVVIKQRERRNSLDLAMKELKRKGAAAKHQLAEVQDKLQKLNAKRDELVGVRGQCEHRRARILEMEAAGIETAALSEQVAELSRRLERGDFAGPKRAQRMRLEAEIAGLEKARTEFDSVRERLRQLDPARSRYESLRHAEDNIVEQQEQLGRTKEGKAALEADLAGLEEQRSALESDAALLEGVRRELQSAERERQAADAESARLQADAQRMEAHVEQCAQGESLRAECEKQLRAVASDRRVYEDLAAAFGKKGIQTHIIESILPELEDDANALLARMTDSALRVMFETTRAAKSTRAEIETLDIRIMDEAGTRPYELFSGGEAFRVNFAIRIALSRLLARRSGAPLQTLIMDEGFGSQDGKGRERLVEVIDTIKEDFEKILVITHVDELRDAFPQRIEVVKDTSGSHIHVY